MPILVTGTVAFDHLFTYDASFLEKLKGSIEKDALSVAFNTHDYHKKFGGTGANIAWNLRLLGSNPLLVANIGKDGGDYVDFLKKADIDTSHLRVFPEHMTSTGVCCTDSREHQIWLFHHGPDSEGPWPDLSAIRKDISYAIIGPRHSERMIDGLRWCKTEHVPVIFDPGQYILQFTKETLRSAIEGCTGVIGNEFEWNQITTQLGSSPAEIATHVNFAIVTKSENGFSLHTKTGSAEYPRCDCDGFKDPTGAGDAFRGGLLTGLTNGWSLEHSCMYGAGTASFAVETQGTLMESIDLAKVRARAKQTFAVDLPVL